jgi:lysophospholipase L1-like esterase
MSWMPKALQVGILSWLLLTGQAQAAEPVEFSLSGDWEITVKLPAEENRAEIVRQVQVFELPEIAQVDAEKYDALPVFNPQGPVYRRGTSLLQLKAQEVTTPFLLLEDGFAVRSGPEASSTEFVRGKDYELVLDWANLGRLQEGRIQAGQPVYITYRHSWLRLDSIILTQDDRIEYRVGANAASSPVPPAPQAGETLLGHVWLPGKIEHLTEDNLFPVLETSYPEPPAQHPSAAERFIPRSLKKLRNGEPLRILAWGDSVTDGAYLPDRDQNRWQNQFVTQLRERFPQAKIELVTEAWGGRNTASYLGVPAGEPHNYQETVLNAKPDLIISEFVNDAGLKPDAVEERYSKLLNDFQGIGAEWIILTPHYTRPDWMGLKHERNIDHDPRPYVAGLREFSARHKVALADASLRYGRLWRQGIPYSTLMSNSINHPNPWAMGIFADALMELFPEK